MLSYIWKAAVGGLIGMGFAVLWCEFLHLPFAAGLVILIVAFGAWGYWHDTQALKGGG